MFGKVVILIYHSENLKVYHYYYHCIILLSLLLHTKHYPQTLYRAVFKSFKSSLCNAFRNRIKRTANRRITRMQFGELLNMSWGKQAVPENAISVFNETRIYPFNANHIPDYAFLKLSISERIPDKNILSTTEMQYNVVQNNIEMPAAESNGNANIDKGYFKPRPSSCETYDVPAPTKVLYNTAPVLDVTMNRKRTKNVAIVLTSQENNEKSRKLSSQKQIKLIKKLKTVKKSNVNARKKRKYDTSSIEKDEIHLKLSDSTDFVGIVLDEDYYVGCG